MCWSYSFRIDFIRLTMGSENNIDKNKLELEFYKIQSQSLWPKVFQQIREESLKKEYSLEEAKKYDNKFLNRYRDVNPYDHSRVILSKPGYSYINASYITVQEARRTYILTQGPLASTINHFWLMAWEHKSSAIVMLNKLIEKSQPKCSQYWPMSVSEGANEMELPEVDLKVELLSELNFSHFIVRNIRLTNLTSEEFRNIVQFHYITWPDFGVPQSPLAFLKFLREIRQSGAFDSEVGPPIVHCSAGIGRSGTFCLVDSCLVMMKEKGIENVNVIDVVLEMRTYRMGLIQTPDQLRFSYVAIIQGLKVDWSSHGNDGLPPDETMDLKNGNRKISAGIVASSSSSDSEGEAPPLPPPRFFPEKPLPVLPSGLPSESESESDSSEGNGSSGNEETNLIKDSDSEEIVIPDNDTETTEEQPTINKTGLPIKRKHSDSEEKSKRISKKVEEMKKKQTDAEKWKKQRSLLTNLTIGISSFLAMSGAILAYLWYRKSF